MASQAVLPGQSLALASSEGSFSERVARALKGALDGAAIAEPKPDKKAGNETSADNSTDSDNVLGFDTSKLKMSQLGALLWTWTVVAIIGVIAFEHFHRRCAGTDLSKSVDYSGETKENQLHRMFTGVWPLVRPYLFQEGSNCPWNYIVVLAVLGLWRMVIHLVFVLWVKEFWDTIENKHTENFMPLMRDFTLLAATAIMVGTYASYIGMMLIIDWRKWMTHWLLREWLKDKLYYRMQLSPSTNTPDNPDQRLQEDINMFIPALVGLVSGFCDSIGQLVSMLPVLLLLSPTRAFGMVYLPGWLLYLAILYSGCGTLAAHLIGSKLIAINFARQKYEADFRYHIVQVRDHAESIALYGSEECERAQLEGRFDDIVRVWWLMMTYTKRLGFFTAFYMQTSFTFPYLVLAPNYFKGQITLGTMFMLFRALNEVKGAFDWIISSYSTLTDFRATVDRLHNFLEAMERRKGMTEVSHVLSIPDEAAGSALVAKEICVRLPESVGGRVVWEAANFVAAEGEFVLLTAPEGSGKSCFFRALAGIWPHASGTVHVSGSMLFVPQRSYIPQGSLKQALAYPESEDGFTDKQVRHALEAVGLNEVLRDRELSDKANWELVLSGGEQQRLAVAHAVLRRPSVLFLDEATSAMGDEGALELFQLLRRPGTLPEGAAVISISHDVKLLGPVHDTTYHYSSDEHVWVKR